MFKCWNVGINRQRERESASRCLSIVPYPPTIWQMKEPVSRRFATRRAAGGLRRVHFQCAWPCRGTPRQRRRRRGSPDGRAAQPSPHMSAAVRVTRRGRRGRSPRPTNAESPNSFKRAAFLGGAFLVKPTLTVYISLTPLQMTLVLVPLLIRWHRRYVINLRQ